jgi:hypothetical protein
VTDILNPTAKPTREDLFALSDIEDPIERGWAAKQISLRAEDTDAPQIAARALTAMWKAVDKIIDQYETMRPLDQGDGGDLVRYGWLAESIRARAKERAKDHRAVRDRAALILIAPFAKAVRPTNEERRQLMVDKKSGKVPARDYYTKLEEITERRRKALADAKVTVFPQHVYKPMGITRGRFIQMIEELADVQLPRMQNPMDVLEKESKIVARLVSIKDEVTPIRTSTFEKLLKVHTNLEVHRLTGMSTARVAQIRNPKRRPTKRAAAR